MHRAAHRLAIGFAYVVAVLACGGPTPVAVPSDVAITGTLPGSLATARVSAEAEARVGTVFAVLAETDADDAAFTLTLSGSAVPAEVRTIDPDVPSLLCPDASVRSLTVSRSPLSWLELRGLWASDGGLLHPVRAASRPGISLDAPGGFVAGDVLHHWIHVERASTVTGTCTYAFGSFSIVHHYELPLVAGWNALRTEISAVLGGVPTDIATTVGASSDAAAWHVGDPVLGNVDIARVPASPHHAHATWWGYHQTKLVRHEADLWVATVDNDVPPGSPSLARVLRQDGTLASGWQEVATFESSRPAQLLLQDGVVHALSHTEQESDYDTIGPVTRHAVGTGHPPLALAASVNIRYGVTVDALGDGWLASGGTPPFLTDGTNWSLRVFAGALDEYADPNYRWDFVHDIATGDSAFQYPYLAADHGRLLLAAVESHHDGDPGGSRQHAVLVAQIDLATRGLDYVHRFDDLAMGAPAGRRRLVDVADLHIGADGRAHLLLHTYVDAADPHRSELLYRVQDDAQSNWVDGPPPAVACDAARFVELPGATSPVIVCTRPGELRVTALDASVGASLRVPPSLRGAYVFVAAPRSGTSAGETVTDILLVSGSPHAYPDGSAFVITIARDELAARLAP